MAKIKTDENASEALDQDPTDDVSRIISQASDVAKSWWSITNPTVTT